MPGGLSRSGAHRLVDWAVARAIAGLPLDDAGLVTSTPTDTHAGTDTAAGRDVRREAARRRTFAVISHPDAGKSTLTEALALHAWVISEAGAVHGKSGRRGHGVGLDGDGEGARHLHHLGRAAVLATATT